MKKLLEYQKIDGEILAIQREISLKSNRDESNNLIGLIKNAQNKTLQFDEEAKKLMDEFNKLLSVEEKGIQLIKKYTEQKVEELSVDELRDLDSKINQATANLMELENRISNHNERAKRVLQEYDILRKKAFSARQKYQENKSSYEALMKEKEPEITSRKEQLLILQKDIDPVLMSKYKSMRQDGFFPVVVPLLNKRCGGCQVELPSNAIEKIKQKGYIECEQCRKIIYIDQI